MRDAVRENVSDGSMSTRALIGRYTDTSGNWIAAWHLFDSAPQALGARILRSLNGGRGSIGELADSFLSHPCWSAWPASPEHGHEEFEKLVTAETVVWAFDWAYLVTSTPKLGIELHSMDSLREGRSPLDFVEVLPGKPPSRRSFRVPKAKEIYAKVRLATTLEELREALTGTPPDFRSRMLAYSEIPPHFELSSGERSALSAQTRVSYVARKGSRCLRESLQPDGRYEYVIERFPPRE